MTRLKTLTLLAKNLLCWILILNHGLMSLAQAMEGMIPPLPSGRPAIQRGSAPPLEVKGREDPVPKVVSSLSSWSDLTPYAGLTLVKAHIDHEMSLTQNLDLSRVERVELTASAPLTFAAQLLVHHLKLTASAPVVVGLDTAHFGHLQAMGGDLIIQAPTISAPFAKLYAARTLQLQGNVTLGEYVEHAPDGSAFLGAWQGSAVDDLFRVTNNNSYRAPNGTLLYGQTIEIHGQMLTLSYCRFFSHLLTHLTSGSPLNLLSVEFMGNGAFSATAPSMMFGCEGTRKAMFQTSTNKPTGTYRWEKGREILVMGKRTTYYDYLLSQPTSLTHVGPITLTITDRADLVGTKIAAEQFIVNGMPITGVNTSGTLAFHALYLGQVPMPRTYRMFIKKGRFACVPFKSLGHMLAGQALPQSLVDQMIRDKQRKWKKLRSHFVPFSPAIKNTSIAEINFLGLCMDDIRHGYILRSVLDANMREAHSHGGVFIDEKIITNNRANVGSWLVHTLAPHLVLGQQMMFHGQTLVGQLGLDSQFLDIYAQQNVSLSKIPSRPAVAPPSSPLVPVDSIPTLHSVVEFQQVFQTQLPGTLAPKPGEIPWVISGGGKGEAFVPPVAPQYQVPIDVVLQAILAQKGCVHGEGLSGRALVDKIVNDSRALNLVHPVFRDVGELRELKNLLLVYLVSYDDVTKNYGLPQLTIYIPEQWQNPEQGAGVLTMKVGKIRSEGDIEIDNAKMSVAKSLVMEAKNLKLRSTPITLRQGRLTQQTVPSPMMLRATPGAKIELKAKENVELKGVQIQGEPGSTFAITAGNEARISAVKMQDQRRTNHSFTRQDHTLPTTIEGFESLVVTALHHFHQAPHIANGQNQFNGQELYAEAVIDYYKRRTQKTKTGMFKTTSQKKETLRPSDVVMAEYWGETILNLLYAHVKGGVFQGKLIDRTKVFEVGPAVGQSYQKIRNSSNWCGVTQGMKGGQGKEVVFPSRIQGEFISERHPHALDVENLLKLTSVILDVPDAKIDKRILKDEYVAKEWCKYKQTGNFKEVAMTASVLISVVSMGWGAAISGMINTMAYAAMTSLCSQAVSSLICHQGNLSQVGKDLMHKRALKNVAVAAISAGLTQGVLASPQGELTPSPACQQLEVGQRFAREMTKAAVNLHVDYALHGGSYKDKFQEYGINGLVASVSGYLCYKLGQGYQKGQIDAVSHKITHGVLGALSSLAQGENVAAGALGAMVAESVAEVFYYAEEQNFLVQQKEWEGKVQKGEVSPQHAQSQIKALMERYQSLKDSSITLGKYAAIAAATLARVDPHVALRTATTALEHDFRDGKGNLLLSMLQSQMGSLNPYKTPSRYELILSMRQSLEDAGATFDQINTLMNDPAMTGLIDHVTRMRGQGSNEPARGIPFGQKPRIEITRGTRDILHDALGSLAHGAEVLTKLADNHPHLTKFTLTALQVALAGPVGFARDQVLERIGVHESVEALTDAGKKWFSHELQSRLGVSEAYANAYAEGGAFGIVFSVGMVGGASKDKVVQSARETTEKVKIYMTYLKPHPQGGVPYVGKTSGTKEPMQTLINRDRRHHMNKKGFGPAEIDVVSTNPHAIRAREQVKIEELGGAKSQGGTSNNLINSISNKNPKKNYYIDEAKKEFGEP